MDISLARVAKSFCNCVKFSPCTISISLMRSSIAFDRSGIENETFTSDSSVGRMGVVIFNSFVYITHADEAFISVLPGKIVVRFFCEISST